VRKAPLDLRYYLAGPMTGLPDFNYPAFEQAFVRLSGMGYQVASPHYDFRDWTEEQRAAEPPATFIKAGMLLLLSCDAVVVLSGWQHSRGTMLELQVATACKMPIYYFSRVMDYPYEMDY
jgi:nucleoside 2-deoxyribosyltransferase